jgi:putative FmdB family regulatory protein
MPIYEYRCEKCDHTFDMLVMQKEDEIMCPQCKGEVRKLMSAFAVGTSNNVPQKLPPAPSRPMCRTC